MNETDSNLFSQNHPYIYDMITTIRWNTFFSLPVASMALFPAYIHITRVNRERDEKTAIFPFIHFFYKATCVYIYLFLWPFLLLILLGILMVCRNTTLMEVAVSLIKDVLLYQESYIIISDILMSYLSLSRFLLYFFPKIGAFITPKKQFCKIAIFIFVVLIILLACGSEETSQEIVYIANISCGLLCVLHYIAMIRSVQKLSHLSSSATFKPELYIKYQVLTIILSKLVILVSAISAYGVTDYFESAFYTVLAPVSNGSATSLAIQSAYLLSNRTNAENFFKSKWSWKLIRNTVLCGKESIVEPERTVYSIASTNSLVNNT